MEFSSDNTDAIVGQVFEALQEANSGRAHAYSNDRFTSSLREKINEIFETDTQIYLTATGTGANAIAMSALTKKYGIVLCNHAAHIFQDETGAPEALMGGARLSAISHNMNSKVTPTEVNNFFSNGWKDNIHNMQANALSITNLTEHGCVYSPDEVKELSKVCKERDLLLHMDGARFTNTIVSTGASPAEMTWKSGVDILSLGLTKLGAMSAEMLVVFNKSLVPGLTFLHKRGAQLFSKSRYAAAQFLGMFKNDLWLDLARHSNELAAKLATAAKEKGYNVLQEVHGNQVFVEILEDKRKELEDAGVGFYIFPSMGVNACRFVTSWNTTEEEVNKFIALL